MKRSKTELLEIVRNYIGDRDDEVTLSLIEDITDSYNDESEDWERRYKELDDSWRQRYRDRFFERNDTEVTVEEQEEATVKKDYEDLFKEGEK